MTGRNHVTIRLSYDQLALTDDRYDRKIASKKTTPPTPEQWAEYRHAKALFEELSESPYFQDGGPDEGATVTKPWPHTEYVYAETEAEWSERCANITGPNPAWRPWDKLRPFTGAADDVLAEYYGVIHEYVHELSAKYFGPFTARHTGTLNLDIPGIGEITTHYTPRTETELFTARLNAPKWPPIASAIHPRNEVAQ